MIFLGPSYRLDNYRASAQRCVNMHLAPVESLNEVARFTLESVPGLLRRVTFADTVRGAYVAAGRMFVVAGDTLYEVHEDWSTDSLGTLGTDVGSVSMAHGLSQLVIADGVNLYVLALGDNTFTAVTDPDLLCAGKVTFLENYFILTAAGQSYQITAINDASDLDALDFASAEGSPDNIVSQLVLGSEVYLFGETSVEVHFFSGNADFPFERNRGVAIDLGLVARDSLCKVDGAAMFIGADESGPASVYIMRGYQPQRVSTRAVEESLATSTNLSGATAWTYTRRGHKVYAINAPGVDSTWCYDLLTQSWYERCDLDDEGQLTQHRVTHAVSFDGGNVFLGGLYAYEVSDDAYLYDTDRIIRERASPHDVAPAMDYKTFGEFVLRCRTGDAALTITPKVELAWSNDGGATWGNSQLQSLGLTGERFARLVWRRLGRSQDRVWRVRFGDEAPFSIVGAEAR